MPLILTTILSTSISPIFVDCGANDNLLFRVFAMLFWSTWIIWCYEATASLNVAWGDRRSFQVVGHLVPLCKVRESSVAETKRLHMPVGLWLWTCFMVLTSCLVSFHREGESQKHRAKSSGAEQLWTSLLTTPGLVVSKWGGKDDTFCVVTF